ncbi:MAG: DUF2851 family protein [Planctomycetota bacterium]
MSINLLGEHLPLASLYRKLRKKAVIPRKQFLVLDRENEFEGITERFVQYLWAEQEPRNIKYKTLDGKIIEVISPGFWNARKGPDFTVARVRIGGKTYSGDVEIHLYASDWYGHKHHLDKAYDNTILHVAFWQDAAGSSVKNSSGKIIPQLVLSPFLSARMEEMEKLLEFIPETMDNYRSAGAGLCYERIKGGGSLAQELLEMAGQARLLAKIRSLGPGGTDLDNVLYRGMMRAMGYRNNQEPFSALARAVGIKVIKRCIGSYRPDEYPLVIQAALLKSAGLVKNIRSLTADAETTAYLDILDSIIANLPELPVAENLKWDFGGTRPANYPHRRIAGISHILAGQLGFGSSLSDSIIGLFRARAPVSAKIDSLRGIFSVGPQGYWSYRSSFSSRPFTRPLALVGADRADEIIVNIIIPFMLLYSRRNKDDNLARSVTEFYCAFPPLADNYIIEFMRYRMFKEDTVRYQGVVDTALRQQGLLQVFNDFCRKGSEECDSCGFNQALANVGISV